MEPYQYQLLGMFLIFVLIIVCIFLAWYFQHKARTRERIALIEKGVDIEKLQRHKSDSWSSLKISIVLISLCVVNGIYTIFLEIDRKNIEIRAPKSAQELLEDMQANGVNPTGNNIHGAAYPLVFFLCIGIAFLIIHYLDREKVKNG